MEEPTSGAKSCRYGVNKEAFTMACGLLSSLPSRNVKSTTSQKNCSYGANDILLHTRCNYLVLNRAVLGTSPCIMGLSIPMLQPLINRNTSPMLTKKGTTSFTKSASLVLIGQILKKIQPLKNLKMCKEMYYQTFVLRTLH